MADSSNKCQASTASAATHPLSPTPPAGPASQHTTITHLSDDLLGLLYARLIDSNDKKRFARAHPTFWKSPAVNARIQSLRLFKPGYDTCCQIIAPPVPEQLGSFPRHSPGLKTLTIVRHDEDHLKATLQSLQSSSAAVRARLSTVECLYLTSCTMTNECAQPLLDLFPHLRAEGGTLMLSNCTVPCEFLFTLGPQMMIRKLGCTDCKFPQAERGRRFEKAISTFRSLHELALVFPAPKILVPEEFSESDSDALADLEPPLSDLFVHLLGRLQQLHTLTLSNCIVIGLSEIFDSVPLETLHLQGKCQWVGEDLVDSKGMPRIASDTLQEIRFDTMDLDLALSFDASELPSLRKIGVSDINLAVPPGSELECLESFEALFFSLPLCIGDGFTLQISGARQGTSLALSALMRLQNLLDGKRVTVVAKCVSPQMIDQLSTLSEVVGKLNIQASTFAGDAMVEAAKRLRGALSIDLDVRTTVSPPVGIIAVLLAATAAQRQEPFCLCLNVCYPSDAQIAERREMFDMYGGEYPYNSADECSGLVAQWAEVQRQNLVAGASMVELKACRVNWRGHCEEVPHSCKMQNDAQNVSVCCTPRT